MGKLEQDQDIKKSQLAETPDDKEYRQWIKEQFLREAKEIEEGLDEVPDSEEWRPTEEKFQALLKKAKERGLLDNADNPLTSGDDGREKTKDNEKDSDNTEQMNEREGELKTKIVMRKRKVIRRAAFAAAALVGVFGISMTSQASRAYIMEEVNKLFGNDVNTKA